MSILATNWGRGWSALSHASCDHWEIMCTGSLHKWSRLCPLSLCNHTHYHCSHKQFQGKFLLIVQHRYTLLSFHICSHWTFMGAYVQDTLNELVLIYTCAYLLWLLSYRHIQTFLQRAKSSIQGFPSLRIILPISLWNRSNWEWLSGQRSPSWVPWFTGDLNPHLPSPTTAS